MPIAGARYMPGEHIRIEPYVRCRIRERPIYQIDHVDFRNWDAQVGLFATRDPGAPSRNMETKSPVQVECAASLQRLLHGRKHTPRVWSWCSTLGF